jgi:4-hydroxy-2-oxoheptanedioate aldolase
MIETREAIENAEEIISTPGVDAIYIGPSDLSVSLGLPPASDHEASEFAGAINKVLALCKQYGVIAGAHCGTTDVAKKRIAQGFRFVQVADDAGALMRSSLASLAAMGERTGAASKVDA